jgi:hypothetical protein
MTAVNPITGDLIKTKTGNQSAYESGWDRIFGKKEKEEEKEEKECQPPQD